MRKKILMRSGLLALSAASVIAMAGCGKTQDNGQETVTTAVAEASGVVMADSDTEFPFGETIYDGRWYMEELVEPENKLKAADIYAQMTYTEPMFYGDYRLNHYNDSLAKHYATQEFIDSSEWWSSTYITQSQPEKFISKLPYRIVAGTAELDNALITDTSHSWCQLFYANRDENEGVMVEAAYTVEGNTITFTPISEWSYDEENALLSYTFEDSSFSYDFSFSGPKLTISSDGTSYTLIERDFTKLSVTSNDHSVTVTSSLSQNSAMVDRITKINFTAFVDNEYKLNTGKSSFELSVIDNDGKENSCNGIARWDEDGLFTFSYQDTAGTTRSKQFVIFYCGFDGVVLSDGVKNYYYLSTFLSEATAAYYTPEELEEIVDGLGANLSEEDQQKLETMTEEEIAEIIETRENLLSDLAAAFAEKGIKADIDETTGEIVLDSSILFAKAKATLSAEGEAALTDFITAFAGVIDDDKYDGFISKVEVQGHTDTDGDYELNLELSQNRAESVRDYCLNDVDSLDKATIAKLEKLLVPVGYSYDHPVYKEDGTIDMNASRRVEFIFFINIAGN